MRDEDFTETLSNFYGFFSTLVDSKNASQYWHAKEYIYLDSSPLSVRSVAHSIHAVTNCIAPHPLIGILPSLSGHAFYTHQLNKVHLVPLSRAIAAHAPWIEAIEPPVFRGQVIVVVSWGG